MKFSQNENFKILSNAPLRFKNLIFLNCVCSVNANPRLADSTTALLILLFFNLTFLRSVTILNSFFIIQAKQDPTHSQDETERRTTICHIRIGNWGVAILWRPPLRLGYTGFRSKS